MTFRTNDDKYIYLPKALTDRSEESVNKLRKDFGEFASNEIHGEYDRGYFKALEDYTTLISSQKAPPPPSSETRDTPSEKVEPTKKDADLSPYLEGSS